MKKKSKHHSAIPAIPAIPAFRPVPFSRFLISPMQAVFVSKVGLE
jgi:hypothetical protein